MLSDYIVFWMQHNARPPMLLGSFEMLTYELHCLVGVTADRIIEQMRSEIMRTLAELGLHLQDNSP